MSNEETRIKVDRVFSYYGIRAVWIKCLVCGNKESAQLDTKPDIGTHSLSNPPQKYGKWQVQVPQHHIKKDKLGRNKKDSALCETSGKTFVLNILPPNTWLPHKSNIT
jgi:hypothetical protein